MASVIFENAAKRVRGLQRERDDLWPGEDPCVTGEISTIQRPIRQEHSEETLADPPARRPSTWRGAAQRRHAHRLSLLDQQLSGNHKLSVLA